MCQCSGGVVLRRRRRVDLVPRSMEISEPSRQNRNLFGTARPSSGYQSARRFSGRPDHPVVQANRAEGRCGSPVVVRSAAFTIAPDHGNQ
jgi:hypothetical protein